MIHSELVALLVAARGDDPDPVLRIVNVNGSRAMTILDVVCSGDIPTIEIAHLDERCGATNPSPAKWSGASGIPIPAIGSVIGVKVNSLGTGIVRDYFVQEEWIGVAVELANPPAWWRDQNPDTMVCHVFGSEIDSGTC